MPAYEVTWTVESSSDEAAVKLLELMRSTTAMVDKLLPADRPKVRLRLAKIMEEQ